MIAISSSLTSPRQPIADSTAVSWFKTSRRIAAVTLQLGKANKIGKRQSQGRLEAADQVIARWNQGMLDALNIRVCVEGTPHPAPVVFVSNHVSWLDPLILGALTPVSVLAKADVADWPAIGKLTRVGQTVFMKRGAHQVRSAIDSLKQRLAAGRPVLFYPEATTSGGESTLFFFPRLFAAAVEAGVPVQPISIDYPSDRSQRVAAFTDKVSFASHFWSMLRSRDISATVRFLPVIETNGLPRKQLASLAREQIALHLPGEQSVDQSATAGRAAIRHLRDYF